MTLLSCFVIFWCQTSQAILCTYAFAVGQGIQVQDNQQSSSNNLFNKLKDPEQGRELQKALEVLQQAANSKAENKTGEQNGSDQEHKTVGDALDKGLDMAKDAVVYLSAKIEQVAPQLWRVMVVQQYVKGVILIIQPLGFLFTLMLYRFFLLKWWKIPAEKDLSAMPLFDNKSGNPSLRGWRGILTIIVPLAGLVVGFAIFYVSITQAAGYFINPNYYAVKDIISIARNPGSF